MTEYVACFSGNLSTFRQIRVEKDDGEEILSMNMIIIHNYYNTIGDTECTTGKYKNRTTNNVRPIREARTIVDERCTTYYTTGLIC